jgi:fructan beta-fructosidase
MLMTRSLMAVGLLLTAASAGAADPAPPADLYREKYRPQFHVTARQWTVRKLNPGMREEGWINDVNGLIYHHGQYHLFAQRWARCWLHLVSKDLVHWTELQPAFWDDKRFGTGVQSGTIVFDSKNVSGLSSDPANPPLVAFWSGFDNRSQCISYSVDHGLTWAKYAKNPYMIRPERDPKVFWYEPGEKWVMVLYGASQYHILNSTDLLTWTDQKNPIPDCFECPDLFQLPVDGDLKHMKWVLVRGNGKYSVGDFDGSRFTPETDQLPCDLGSSFYATQSWGDIPGQPGRRVQIAWMRGGQYPDMPFNQQLSFPCDLTLRSFPEGLRVCRLPAGEIKSLYGRKHTWKDELIKPGENLLKDAPGELFDIQLQATVGGVGEFGIKCRGAAVTYSAEKKTLTCLGKEAPLEPAHGQVTLRILVDRTSIEVFGNDGKVSMSSCFLPGPDKAGLELFANGGSSRILSMTIYELKSAWATGSKD